MVRSTLIELWNLIFWFETIIYKLRCSLGHVQRVTKPEPCGARIFFIKYFESGALALGHFRYKIDLEAVLRRSLVDAWARRTGPVTWPQNDNFLNFKLYDRGASYIIFLGSGWAYMVRSTLFWLFTSSFWPLAINRGKVTPADLNTFLVKNQLGLDFWSPFWIFHIYCI